METPHFGKLAALTVALLIVCTAVSCKTSPRDGSQSASFKTLRSFSDRFNRHEALVETGKMDESTDPNWWLNSGARMFVNAGSATTVRGALPENDGWRIKFAKHNPGETDGGFHPQNIFRLVTRETWGDLEQKARFKILDYHLSEDAHRQASNGLLLFNRYRDGDDLYYTGIRVDGRAIIKKKARGTYYTMASEPLFPGTYDRAQNPNLLPLNRWIGLKSVIMTNPDKTVSITLYVDTKDNGDWSMAARATDDGKRYGGEPILRAGHAGIRTDFMDAEFADYSIQEAR